MIKPHINRDKQKLKSTCTHTQAQSLKWEEKQQAQNWQEMGSHRHKLKIVLELLFSAPMASPDSLDERSWGQTAERTICRQSHSEEYVQDSVET